MTETPLKPCPFCGSVDTGTLGDRALCNWCGAGGPMEDRTGQDWNRRSGRDGNAENAPKVRGLDDTRIAINEAFADHVIDPLGNDRPGAAYYDTHLTDLVGLKARLLRILTNVHSHKVDYDKCANCSGEGNIADHWCDVCGGTGEAKKSDA